MTDYAVDFLGCKISHTDAEGIADALESAGYSRGDGGALQVLNTCCITGAAERKSRKQVRRMLDSGADRVIVTGCAATLDPERFAAIDERVTVLDGPAALQHDAVLAIADELPGLGCKGASHDEVTEPAAKRTRAFVKIQDGCDFPCSYCIVPTVRGASRSRGIEGIVRDVQRAVGRGQREIVLTGVNIGLWRDPVSRISLPRLLPLLAAEPGVARIRISSIEINHVSPRLVQAIADTPGVCPHLHIPMQSGDAGVLRAMRRNYSPDRYAQAIDRARAIIPDLNLSTDIIVGFPGEDDDAYEATRQLAAKVGFTKVHTFPFSARPGTDAGDLDGDIDPRVVRERSATLRADATARLHARNRSRIGVVDDIITERPSGRAGDGYLRDYTRARLTTPLPSGSHIAIRIVGSDDDGLIVEPVGVGSRTMRQSNRAPRAATTAHEPRALEGTPA